MKQNALFLNLTHRHKNVLFMAIDAEKQDKAMAKYIFLHVNVFLE